MTGGRAGPETNLDERPLWIPALAGMTVGGALVVDSGRPVLVVVR